MTLTKVIFEYSDKTQKYITGEELDKWMQCNMLLSSIGHTHNINPPYDQVKWTRVENFNTFVNDMIPKDEDPKFKKKDVEILKSEDVIPVDPQTVRDNLYKRRKENG